jgi:hypothetical protein
MTKRTPMTDTYKKRSMKHQDQALLKPKVLVAFVDLVYPVHESEL